MINWIKYICTLAVVWSGSSQIWAQDQTSSGGARVKELQSKLVDARTNLSAKKQEQRTGILETYRKGLVALGEQLQESADLAGVVQARAELARLNASSRLDESHLVAHSRIAAWQEKAMARSKQLDEYTAKQMVSLAEKWTAAMNNLQAELVRDGDIAAATAAKSAVDKLAFAVWLAEAQAILNKPEPAVEPASPEPEVAGGGGAPPAVPAAPKEEQKDVFPTVPTIYVNNDASTEGRPVSIRADYPSTASRAAAAKASGRVLFYRVDRVKQRDGSYYWNDKQSAERYVPRITIAPNGGRTFSNCTVVFEYVGRRSSGGGSQVSVLSVEAVTLPEFSQSVTIDGGGYVLFKDEYYYSGDLRYYYFGENMLKDAGYAMEHGYGSSSKRSDLFGFIVSVYAEDGSLLFQRTTSNKASPAARSTFDPKTQSPKDRLSTGSSFHSGKDPFK